MSRQGSLPACPLCKAHSPVSLWAGTAHQVLCSVLRAHQRLKTLTSHAPHTPPLVEDKADVRTRAKGLQPHPYPRALPALPVWEHTVVTPLRTHGFRDVTGYKPSFLHGINIVSRGLKYGVVGHEVSGPNVSVISLNVNS